MMNPMKEAMMAVTKEGGGGGECGNDALALDDAGEHRHTHTKMPTPCMGLDLGVEGERHRASPSLDGRGG